MLGLILGIGIPVAYLVIGFTWSRKMLPRWWDKARREWKYEDMSRESVKMQFFLKAIVWPVLLPLEAINFDFDRLIDQSDPRTIRERADRQARRIQELERELGMK